MRELFRIGMICCIIFRAYRFILLFGFCRRGRNLLNICEIKILVNIIYMYVVCCFVRYYILYRFYKYYLLEIIFFKCLGDIV